MTVERATRAAKDGPHGMNRKGNARNPDRKPRHMTLSGALGSHGSLLPEPLRADMQGRFASDFSHVRIHADAQAGAIADGIGARAFTISNHIVFGTGRFAAGQPDGVGLIAHVLAHVVQQQPLARDAALPTTLRQLPMSRRGDAAEREATSVADQVMRGETCRVFERSERSFQAHWEDASPDGDGGVASPAPAVGTPDPISLDGGTAAAPTFPTYADITGDADVSTKITAAWKSTEAAATATKRREEGFGIRKNVGTGKFEFTATKLGPSIGPTQTGSVKLGRRPADTDSGKATAIYTVGSFHTHTPTAFRTVGRPVGPSSADQSTDTSDDVCGVVYDYTESAAGSGDVPAGHPIGSSAQAYHSGPDKRQTL